MSLTQLMSTDTAIDLLQSVGTELSIFAITLAVALAFHGTPFGKKVGCAASTPNPPRTRTTPFAKPRVASPERPEAVPAPGLAGLAKKTKAMLDCVNWRQDADAIAMYMDIRKSLEPTHLKESLTIGKHRAVDFFSMLVQCAGRAGQTELIEVLLTDMKLAGVERSLAFYEKIMKMLASLKCYKEAMTVCSCLEADGLEPSPVTLSCLINFAVELGDTDRAISFFNRLASASMPSIRAYMTILRVHSKNRDWSKALALLRDMQMRQAPIDSLVLNVVLATGVAAGQLQAAKSVLEEFSKIQVADVVSFNTVMKGFAQQKEVEKAVALLEEMSDTSVKANAITYNTAIDAAIRSARVADAYHVLTLMRDAGLAPDKFTCTTLMKGLQHGATSDQLTVILDLLRNTIKDCDWGLCGSLFRNVIEAAAQVNDAKLTARAIAQMREQRVMLSAHDYHRLLAALMKGDQSRRK